MNTINQDELYSLVAGNSIKRSFCYKNKCVNYLPKFFNLLFYTVSQV